MLMELNCLNKFPYVYKNISYLVTCCALFSCDFVTFM